MYMAYAQCFCTAWASSDVHVLILNFPYSHTYTCTHIHTHSHIHTTCTYTHTHSHTYSCPCASTVSSPPVDPCLWVWATPSSGWSWPYLPFLWISLKPRFVCLPLLYSVCVSRDHCMYCHMFITWYNQVSRVLIWPYLLTGPLQLVLLMDQLIYIVRTALHYSEELGLARPLVWRAIVAKLLYHMIRHSKPTLIHVSMNGRSPCTRVMSSCCWCMCALGGSVSRPRRISARR